jgi:hypothetical protein
MNVPTHLEIEHEPPPLTVDELLDELRATERDSWEACFLPFMLAIAFGGIAWRNGHEFAGVFAGGLAVVFTLLDIGRRRRRKQVDLIALLLHKTGAKDEPKITV